MSILDTESVSKTDMAAAAWISPAHISASAAKIYVEGEDFSCGTRTDSAGVQ